MGKISVLYAENVTVGTGNVLTAFQTPAAGTAGSRVAIKRLEIAQNSTTTLAMVRGEFATRNTAGTLTTTATSPVSIRPLGGPASGFTGNVAPAGGTGRSGTNSSADSGGTYTSLVPFAFANTAGYLFKPDPTEEIQVAASTLFVVRLLGGLTSAGWTFALWLDEDY